MKHLLAVANALCLSAASFGQTNLYRNDAEYTSSWGPSGPTGTFLGQPDFSQWTRWPERGSQVVLEGNRPSTLTAMTVWYLGNVGDGLQGPENVTVQIYANDGGQSTGSNGSPLRNPGTLIWTSSAIPIKNIDEAAHIPMPNVQVPGSFTYTLKFQGGNLDVGPFDPAFNINLAGGRFHGNAVNGQSFGPTGVTWRRVFTGSGPSQWAGQERPSTFPQTVPFNFGASFWIGDTWLNRKGYDNKTNAESPAYSYPLPDSTSRNELGQIVAVETSNRIVERVEASLVVDTPSETGNPVAKVRLYNVSRIPSSQFPLVWESRAIPLPKGVRDLSIELDEQVPDIELEPNGQVLWTIVVEGMTSGGTAAPVARGRSRKRGMTDPGATSNNFLVRRGNGGFEQVVVPNDPPGSGTYVFDNPSTFDFRITTAAEGEARPSAFRVTQGRNESGNLASLQRDDSDALRVCLVPVSNPLVRLVSVEFDAPSATPNPTRLKAMVRARMVPAGLYEIRLELRDQVANAWVDATTGIIRSGGYQTFGTSGTGDLSRFVRNGLVTMRYSIVQTGPTASSVFCADTDVVRLVVD